MQESNHIMFSKKKKTLRTVIQRSTCEYNKKSYDQVKQLKIKWYSIKKISNKLLINLF